MTLSDLVPDVEFLPVDDARREPFLVLGLETSCDETAAALVELAHPQALREEFMPVWELRPLYLRKADAEINWETRDRVAVDRGGAA